MNKLLCLALLPLLFGASAAMAHDDTECALEGEATCDEVDVSPQDWNDCRDFVADLCTGHVDPADTGGGQGVNSAVHRSFEMKVKREVSRFKLRKQRETATRLKTLQKRELNTDALQSRQLKSNN